VTTRARPEAKAAHVMRTQGTAAVIGTGVLLLSGALTVSAAAADPTPAPLLSTTTAPLSLLDGPQAPLGAGTSRPGAAAASPATAAGDKKVRSRSVRLADYDGDAPAGAGSLGTIDVVQDVVAKRISLRLAYATAPPSSDPTNLVVVLGTWNDDDACALGSTGAVLAAHPSTHEAAAQLANGTALSATAAGSGTSYTVTTVANAAIASAPWECAFARTVSGSDSSTIYQQYWAESLETAYVPVITLRADADPTVGARAKKWTKYEVEVNSTGDTAARGVTVSFQGKGVKFSAKKVSLGTIDADDDKTATVKVRLSKTKKLKKKVRKATVTVSAQGVATSRQKLRVLPVKKTTTLPSLAHEYFWGWRSQLYQGWDNHGLYFVDKRWAYVGFPGKSLPKHCSAKQKKCERYSYSPRTGKLRIGKKKGKASSISVTYDGMTFYRLAVPKKGKKLAVDLIHRDFSGCNMLPYCSTWTNYLTLDKKGRFTLSSSSLSSFGTPWTTETWVSKVPPDERGRYRILSRGRIELQYASGKKVVQPIGIELDVREKPSPRYEGVVIGDTNYYDE